MADEWIIEPLNDSHERAAFQCGKASLDEFLRSFASQYERRKIGRTYVAVRSGDAKVAGYFTLAASSIAFQNLPSRFSKKLPKHPVPAIHLGRLAVDQSARGQGLGAMLLLDALKRCAGISRELGLFAVDVRAIDEDAKAFYLKFGFIPLMEDELHLFLPVKTIEQLFAEK